MLSLYNRHFTAYIDIRYEVYIADRMVINLIENKKECYRGRFDGTL
jgi:hypothetical protein